MARHSLLLVGLLLAVPVRVGFAGDVYTLQAATNEVDPQTGLLRTITYDVTFGGGFISDMVTAFDPKSRKFVYLTWKRDEKAPQPIGEIWDPHTGKTLRLFKFPGVEHPLPEIPSISDMKVCPFTGGNFLILKRLLYD